MTISFTRFGDVDLPNFNPITQAGTRPADNGIVATAGGGAFDRLGDDQAYQSAGTVSMVATYHNHSETDSLRDYRQLKAMSGKKNWLYRREWGESYDTRIYARLSSVAYSSRIFNLNTYFDIRMDFILQDYCWNGQRWGNYELAGQAMKLTSSYGVPGHPNMSAVTFTATGGESSTTMTVTNQGNVNVRGVMIEVAGATSTLTGFTVTDGATIDLDFTGNIASNETYYMDTAGKTIVDQDGTGAYASFQRGGNHTKTDWLIIPPGSTDFTVSPYTGNFPAGVVVKMHYADGWQ